MSRYRNYGKLGVAGSLVGVAFAGLLIVAFVVLVVDVIRYL